MSWDYRDCANWKPPNKALQTDERRALVITKRKMTLAPLAAERQSR